MLVWPEPGAHSRDGEFSEAKSNSIRQHCVYAICFSLAFQVLSGVNPTACNTWHEPDENGSSR